MTIKDSSTGEYQWIFVAATDIQDVTKDHQSDLSKYPVILPTGKTPADITEDYIFEIKLRPEMKWENGDPITADDYIYSMQQQLNPKKLHQMPLIHPVGNHPSTGGIQL